MSIRLYAILMACLIPRVEALELHDFAIEYRRFDAGSRLPEVPGFKISQSIAVSFEISQGFWKLPVDAFWKNSIHGEMETQGQFRGVGWAFCYGLRYRWVEAGRCHHSRHILDAAYDWPGVGGFPLEDAWVLRVRLAE